MPFSSCGKHRQKIIQYPASGENFYPLVMRSNTRRLVFCYLANYINDLRVVLFFLPAFYDINFSSDHKKSVHFISWRFFVVFVSTFYRNKISTDEKLYVASRLYCNVKLPLNTCALENLLEARDWKVRKGKNRFFSSFTFFRVN